MRPGGIATPEGLSAAVRAGMQHLATHKGDIAAGLASVKAAGAAGHNSEPTPPTPWTHRISKAEADRLFVAACHAAAREAAQSPAFHAGTDQRIEAVDAVTIAGAPNDRPEVVPVTTTEIAAHDGDAEATIAAARATRAVHDRSKFIKVQVVTFGHGDRHVTDPESARAEILQNLPPSEQIVGPFWGITPNFTYRAYPLSGGRLNIGTYYDR